MKAIQLRKHQIEIPFINPDGTTAFTVYFDRSDENKKKLFELYPTLEKKMNEFTVDPEKADFDKVSEFLKEVTDGLFGEGVFDKLYSLTPATEVVAIYVLQMAEGVKEEFEQEDIRDVERKYLG